MNKDFAVIATGGKQYRVSVGDKLKIEKLAIAEGSPVVFDRVLLRSMGENVEIGVPTISAAVVEAKLLRNAKEKTKIVFKYHAKARYRKKKGHRQQFTEVEILKI
jgi:large subunit ribosomal protein L21